jgi:hypothetical protein
MMLQDYIGIVGESSEVQDRLFHVHVVIQHF